MDRQTVLLLSIISIIAVTAFVVSDSYNDVTGQISLKKVVKKWQKEIAKVTINQQKPVPAVSPTLTKPVLEQPKPPTIVDTNPLAEIKHLPQATVTQKFSDSSPVHTAKLPEGFGV